jgi:hypothetical protein
MSSDEILEFLRHQLDPAAFEKAQTMLRAMTDTSATDADLDDIERLSGSPRPGAMDQRMAYDMAATSPGKIVANREVAISEVEGVVGRHTVLACDSAASVFQTALKQMGVPTQGIHVSALPSIFRAHRDRMRRTSAGGSDPRPYVAQDSRSAAAFAKSFPDLARIKAL